MIKIWLWRTLGLFFVGLAYIGAVTPVMPTTTFAVLAGWAFAKSSPRLNKWLHEHPVFGKYLTNWETKKVYPTHGKWAMVGFMVMSLIIMFFTVSVKTVIYSSIFFLIIVIWAWRYPGSVEEYERRVQMGERVAWLK
jgi:uncharacterized membrane protein YbaN (DUF454 family)